MLSRQLLTTFCLALAVLGAANARELPVGDGRVSARPIVLKNY